jgi:hypothetical protein
MIAKLNDRKAQRWRSILGGKGASGSDYYFGEAYSLGWIGREVKSEETCIGEFGQGMF